MSIHPDDQTATAVDALKRIVAVVTIFDKRCNAAEYTDVGDAWETFHRIRDIAKDVLDADLVCCEAVYTGGTSACYGTGSTDPAVAPIPNGEWAQNPYGNSNAEYPPNPAEQSLGQDTIRTDTAARQWHDLEGSEIGLTCGGCWPEQTSPTGTLYRIAPASVSA